VSTRAQNILFPVVTVLMAFVVGGLVVLLTGHNPLTVYKSLWLGAGFDWPFRFIPGNPFGINATLSSINLQATLVEFTPLVLTGLAVAFAYRCGLFNIGGQGQFWVGAFSAYIVAEQIGGSTGVILGTLAGAVGGAVWAGIAGGLKAFRGAHEVITTIMLNWIAIYGGAWLFGLTGPLNDKASGEAVSKTLGADQQYRMLWGNLEGPHTGIIIALVCAFLFWLILNRTTLGYGVRAVGLNPDAARYGGVGVRRSMILAMAISGSFAGLAGAGELFGVTHHVATAELTVSQVGFTGIAVALLGRNTAVGVILGALLFSALDSGARFLSGSFSPELARSLGTVIQGTIILLVGGELAIRWVLTRRGRGGGDIEPIPELHLPAAEEAL
jgi:simple sugar transport system permease protein